MPKTDASQVTQMNAGAKRPLKEWRAMEMLDILWVVGSEVDKHWADACPAHDCV